MGATCEGSLGSSEIYALLVGQHCFSLPFMSAFYKFCPIGHCLPLQKIPLKPKGFVVKQVWKVPNSLGEHFYSITPSKLMKLVLCGECFEKHGLILQMGQ